MTISAKLTMLFCAYMQLQKAIVGLYIYFSEFTNSEGITTQHCVKSSSWTYLLLDSALPSFFLVFAYIVMRLKLAWTLIEVQDLEKEQTVVRNMKTKFYVYVTMYYAVHYFDQYWAQQLYIYQFEYWWRGKTLYLVFDIVELTIGCSLFVMLYTLVNLFSKFLSNVDKQCLTSMRGQDEKLEKFIKKRHFAVKITKMMTFLTGVVYII